MNLVLVGSSWASFKIVGGAAWLAMVKRMLLPMEPEMGEVLLPDPTSGEPVPVTPEEVSWLTRRVA